MPTPSVSSVRFFIPEAPLYRSFAPPLFLNVVFRSPHSTPSSSAICLCFWYFIVASFSFFPSLFSPPFSFFLFLSFISPPLAMSPFSHLPRPHAKKNFPSRTATMMKSRIKLRKESHHQARRSRCLLQKNQTRMAPGTETNRPR
jgi:hypothetical protein